METKVNTMITVQSIINVPVERVWKYWTTPVDIMGWNNASRDWYTPRVRNDLRTGGSFSYRMEARDGSTGFDFDGVYVKVSYHELIEYVMNDGRKVKIVFKAFDNKVEIVETFEAESIHPVEIQRSGWQAILDNFKNYAEMK